MATDSKKLQQESDDLYERYGRPLEAEHRGKFVVISREGKTVVGMNLIEVAEEAVAAFGPGGFLFKIGEKSVWKFR
ncbi:MAG TPA: hypothetical protein VI789_04960 [Dehalococcoidia bacterium]|nr:hypothetical protein [Dehalococcoidia bacterium]